MWYRKGFPAPATVKTAPSLTQNCRFWSVKSLSKSIRLKMPFNAHLFPASGKIREIAKECWEIFGLFGSVPALI